MKSNKYFSKLNFRVINITSKEEDNTINPKVKFSKLLQKGGYEWVSERFCSYPQEIIIQFDSPVNLSQINLLCNEKKTAKHLIFHSFCPDEFDDKKYNYNEIEFQYIGFVDLNDNKDVNYQVREYKKVFINIKTLFLKIILDINYINNYNKFQQVGIKNIECLGNVVINNPIVDIDIKDKEKINQMNLNIEKAIREIIGDKYDIFIQKFIIMDKKENNDEYLKIKNKIEEMNNVGKKIYQIKLLEKNASYNDDFDKAIELKNKGEKLKNKLNDVFDEINKILDSGINNNSNETQNEKEKENSENNEEINEININNENPISILKNNSNKECENNKANKSKIQISLAELDLLKDVNDHDNTVVPSVTKKLRKNKSEADLKAEDEKRYKQKLEPLEELKEEMLNEFKLLINYIKEDGLRYLLSNQIGYKIKGFQKLSNELNNIFLDDNLNELIYELINLESMFLDNKNISAIIKSFPIIKKTFNQINYSELDLKKDKKLLKYIRDNILNKIQSKLGDGEIKIRTGAYQLYLSILRQNLFNFNSLLNNLLSGDINENIYNPSSNNSQNIKIFTKLNIIKNILEDYETIINENYSTEESFPKDLILDYILMNIKNNKIEIKNITRELLELSAKIFGLENIKQKIYFYIDDEKELEKIISQISSLKDLLRGKKPGLTKSSSQANVIRQKPKKTMKLKKNASQLDIKNNEYKKNLEEIKSNYKFNNKNNKNRCDLCRKNLGTIQLSEHKKKCLMYSECEGCGEDIAVEKLNYHKLNACSNKKKFKECKKCKEAIKFDLYDLHLKKNVCNFKKDDMNRCPLCHHDIEKSDDGFYQHLIIDGCAYQKTN